MVFVALDKKPVRKRPEGCNKQPSGLFLWIYLFVRIEEAKMRNLYLIGRLLSAALRDFVEREEFPVRHGHGHPPIRCGGDPTKIYLA